MVDQSLDENHITVCIGLRAILKLLHTLQGERSRSGLDLPVTLLCSRLLRSLFHMPAGH